MLTSYNGETITYDKIGNPLSYKGNTLTWNARELKTLKNDSNNISYTYDANGMRASKTVNGVKSTFEYVGGKLVYEKRGNMDIYYQYDSNGNLSAIRYVDGTVDNIYYTVCNSRGDVEAIYGGGGGLKARYIYDSWGNTVKIVDANGNEITDKNTVGYINPIRYRGYYYDAETGFYYLQSRYYDPETGRFLNADGYVSTGSGVLDTNMFAYCGNNPVNMVDESGKRYSKAYNEAIRAIKLAAWAGIVILPIATSKSKNSNSNGTLSNFKNKDGSYSLHDNQRNKPKDVFHEQVLRWKTSKPAWEPKKGNISLGSGSVTLITGGWEFEHVNISALDFGEAKLGLGLEDGELNASAMASIWSPSITVTIWDTDITISGHVGSIGGEFNLGNGKTKIGGAYGLGLSISF